MAGEVGTTYAQVRQGYPVALKPQQIGLTGEYLSQRMGWCQVIQPQYPGTVGLYFRGWYDPAGIPGRSAAFGYGLAEGLQRSGIPPAPGSGPAALSPALYNAYLSKVGSTPEATRAVSNLSSVQGAS